MAVGSASSNPSAGSNHYSVIYKDAAGNKYFIDAQGIMSDTSCEEQDVYKRQTLIPSPCILSTW